MNRPTSEHPQVKKWLEHVRVLAESIGPRGSTRREERKGASYVRSQLKKFGLNPVWETFRSPRSAFHPHLLGASLMLTAFAIYSIPGRVSTVIAAGLSLLVLISEFLELELLPNLFRLLIPKGESQNVFAIIPPKGEHLRDLVLVGHVDSQHTPLIFRSPLWVKRYDLFSKVAMVTFVLQTLCYLLAIFYPSLWIWTATVPTAICAMILAALCLEAEATPFCAGANDNASAVGMVLTLAEQFINAPLTHTRIFTVLTGCEEVQHYGMAEWYKQHRPELLNPKAIIFEMLGCAGPAWITQEGLIIPFYGDSSLLQMAEEIRGTHPELGAYPTSLSGGNSELAEAVRFHVPAITLFGIKKDGEVPYWHQREDTFDKMNPEVMERTWKFTNALIERIDTSVP